jgi:acetylornithine deacetylase/succinyl-diaminopimelate desuccinylase-like protein
VAGRVTREELLGRLVACDSRSQVSSMRRAVEGAVGAGDVVHHALCALTGQRESRAVSFTTDGGWLAALGLDCIVWGPGSIQAAHKANEWLEVEEFERGAALLESLVADRCVGRPR